jgi:hypothetical protein
MSNDYGVTYKPREQEHKDFNVGCTALALFFGGCWTLIYIFLNYGNTAVVFFKRHYIEIFYAIGAILVLILLHKLKGRFKAMFERLMMNADEKEFAKITRELCREKYVALKTYFKATGTSVESANKFLSSCRGVAFLDAYTKEKDIDNVAISKLILNVEREEQIVACAVDILKSY